MTELRRSTMMRMVVLWVSLFIGLMLTSLLTSVTALWDERTNLLVSSAVQCLLAFIIPAYLMARFASDSPSKFLGITTEPHLKSLLGALLLFAIALPAMEEIIKWNQNIHLPASMEDIEDLLRKTEDMGAAAGNLILSSKSVGGLVSGILIIGGLTGFAEELFFRGALQKSLASGGRSVHFAVWVSAIIFSAVHFQFFGFIPRLLLGLFFGYVYAWTGTIWLPAILHAINNGMVVLISWLTTNGWLTESTDSGKIPFSAPLAWASAIGFVIILTITKNYFFAPRHKS